MAKRNEAVAVKEEVRRLVQANLPSIFSTALDLLKDQKLASNARVQLISVLFRAGGMFDSSEDPAEKEHHELTWGELQGEISRLERASRRTVAGGDVFD